MGRMEIESFADGDQVPPHVLALLDAYHRIIAVLMMRMSFALLRREGRARRSWLNGHRRAVRSRIEPPGARARKRLGNLSGPLAHCGDPLHTGTLQRIHNGIKLTRPMACGCRNGAYRPVRIRAAFPCMGRRTGCPGRHGMKSGYARGAQLQRRARTADPRHVGPQGTMTGPNPSQYRLAGRSGGSPSDTAPRGRAAASTHGDSRPQSPTRPCRYAFPPSAGTTLARNLRRGSAAERANA